MSTATPLAVDPGLPPKLLGDGLEDELIARHDELVDVPDETCEWHDAYVDELWTPTGHLPFGGICLVEIDTPVEIKTAKVATSNGANPDTDGRWYIKRDAHQRLVETRGVYLLAVYAEDEEDDQCVLLAQIVVPASLLDEHLKDRWYDSGRREGDVAKLAWTHVIPRTHVGGDA